MTLWEILKANKTGIAPDMFTMLAASKMNGGRDRLHELTGTPPLSFKAKGKPLTAWSITGNTVQNGTPTPENPVEVQGVGDYDSETGLYKIPVVTRGNNLLKLKEVDVKVQGVTVSVKNNSIAVKGTATSSGGRTVYLSENFILQPGTYFISGDIVNGMVYCLTDRSNGTAVVASSTSKFTLTEKAEVAFGLNFISGASYDATVNVMLNEGDKKFPYEPYHEPITTPIYLPTPLYSGEVLRSDGSREVKWGKLVLTGEETITRHKIFADGVISIRIPSLAVKKDSIVYCTHLQSTPFIKLYNNEIQGVSTHSSYILNNLYCLISGFTTLNQYKDFFSTKYAAGTPVTVWYQLEEPTTKTFTAPQIPTINGTTVIDVDTAVKPERMTIKYRR